MLPQAKICHNSPGRLRVRIPDRKDQKEYFRQLRDQVMEVDGVQSTTINPMTASLLVEHDTNPDKILQKCMDLRLFDPDWGDMDSSGRHQPLVERVRRRFRQVDDAIKNYTRGEMDLSYLAAVGCVGLGLRQAWRGKFLPAGLTMVLYTANLITRQEPATETD